ncbi:hypothetical protein B7C42_05233 [Nocardia cerradoensis]|uniref:Uncharacterized protein n=1 Tax=Nocardia cerradoensis TaxID=85688 RepID=A0A231H0X3_9NOCA|nr:hypothetical protein B7C42_05233 [Nocardia cerradoensis]
MAHQHLPAADSDQSRPFQRRELIRQRESGMPGREMDLRHRPVRGRDEQQQ